MRCALTWLLLAPALAGCLGTGTSPLDASAPGGFSGTAVFPGVYDKSFPVSTPLVPGPFKPLSGEVVELESAVDGVKMQVGIVRPDVPEGVRVPVIAQASPYFPPLQAERLHGMTFYLLRSLLPHGYALALIAVRGTADNEGCEEYFGPQEQADLDQAITWLGQQPWSSGTVGMWGGSYDGGTQWEVASRGNPHLKTIVPLAGVNDPFLLLYQNGTASNRGLWHSTSYWLDPGLTEPNTPANGRSADRMVRSLNCPGAVEGQQESAAATLGGPRTAYWQARNLRPGVEANYRGSVFLIQGLQDWNVKPSQQYPWVSRLEEQGIVVKHLLGQWAHMLPDHPTGVDLEKGSVYGPPYLLSPHVLDYALGNPHFRWDFAEMLLRWYDYWLRGNTSIDLGPRAQVEDSSGRWRSEEHWPPHDARVQALYLTADGQLAEEPSDAPGTRLVGPSQHMASTLDPGRAGLQSTCSGCAVFETGALPELRLSGIPQVLLTATPLGLGGQLAAYLYAVDGLGARRIGLGAVDLRFADGNEEPEAVSPGQAMPVTLQLEPLDAVVPAGARLQLVITQGGESDHATAMELPTSAGPVELQLGGEQGRLLLPVIVRGPEAFFEPP